MEISRSTFFRIRQFRIGELASMFGSLSRSLTLEDKPVGFSINEILSDGSEVWRDATQADLESICNLVARSISCTIGNWPDRVYLSLSQRGSDYLRLYVSSAQSSIITEVPRLLQQALALEEVTEHEAMSIDRAPEDDRFQPLLRRIEQLENAVFEPKQKLRCFLSYRFSSENEILALKLSQFLKLLDVEVITGASYEPRQVSQKVLSRLREPLNFIVLLVTKTGESMWTRDEVGAALHKGLALVPIVENGAVLQPGMFADIEYVSFEPDHIGDAFLNPNVS